jgi:hypothetical protein
MRRVVLIGSLFLMAACERTPVGPSDRIAAADVASAVIETELAEGNMPEWGGEYRASSGFTTDHLFLAPRSGFAYFCRSCTGKDALTGRVSFTDGVLHLEAEVPPNLNCGFTVPTEVVPVSRGARRFLLCRVSDVAKACSAQHEGHLPFRTLTAVANTEATPDGPLLVPPESARINSRRPSSVV